MVAAHTVQVRVFAVAFLMFGAFPTMAASFYFAVVTYTTHGYGDIVLAKDLRVFGAFASITGHLTFGISTALLLGVIVRVQPATLANK